MSRAVVELHPVYNVFLYLNKLKNIELPYRGYYQVRLNAAADGGSSDAEVRLHDKERKEGEDSLLPACTVSRTAVSRTVEVIYADEEFHLADGFVFSLKSTAITPLKFTVTIELWFCDRNQPPKIERFQKLNSRKMLIALSPSSCVASARLAHWEYGACASLSIGVMAALVSLLPRRRKDPPDPPLSDALVDSYRQMSECLLGTTQSINEFIRSSTKHIGAQLVQNASLDDGETMLCSLKTSSSPWKTLEADAVDLSTSLSELFIQSIDLCGRNEGVFRHLLHDFTLWHSRRLSEAFFSIDRSCVHLGAAPLLPLSALLSLLSAHPYLGALPRHPLCSPQLDYSLANMCYIFEEVFVARSPASTPLSEVAEDVNDNDTTVATTPVSIVATSPLSPDERAYSARSLEQLAEYANQKESIKSSLAELAGCEFRMLSECVRSQLFTTRNGIVANGGDAASRGTHLIIMVHGLEGARDDLWPYRVHLKRLLSGRDVHFLCSRVNEGSTWGDVTALGESLLAEMDQHMATMRSAPTRVSFIAHSLGGLIVRAAVAHPDGAWLRSRLHTLLTLNSPHLGLVYAKKTSHVGLTLVQWYKRSRCLAQLSLRDTSVFTESFLVRLASSGSLTGFKNVLLMASSGDIMVPRHSALLSTCPAADKDRSSMSAAFTHMVDELHKELADKRVVRYSCIHRKHDEKLRGRPAHTACVEDSVFIEKLLSTSAINYFY